MNIEVCGDLFADAYPYHRGPGGISFWANVTGVLKIIKEEGSRAIIRESGHRYFSGIGNWPRTGPRYYIGVFTKSVGRGSGLRVVDCFTAFYSIQYTRETAKGAKELAEELYDTLKEEK